jgi:colicin import membrane protein
MRRVEAFTRSVIPLEVSMSFRHRSARWARLLPVMLLAVAPLAAQDMADTQLDPVAADTFLVLVPYRPMSEIRSELDRVREARRDAQAERQRSEELERRVDAVMEVNKRQIALIKSREDFAKKEKREADQAQEKTNRDQAELVQKMLERRKQLRQTESDVAQAEQQADEARVKALETELALAEKRQELERAPRADTARMRMLRREISQLERRTLQDRAEAAGKERSYAERARQLAERRLSLHDAQEKLAGAVR